jgi:hypothetical protein
MPAMLWERLCEGGKLMNPWIYADLDTIIDSYSEAEEDET